jgi:hypothetical protein
MAFRMIDPMVALAFTVYSNKGAYALLLGSGVSRASGIPTGWEVVLDLVRKVARLEGEECDPDPLGWFRTRHGADPSYSKLLDQVAKTPTERQQLLRSYFEPSEEERGQGLKLPSAAHRAIAQLVAAGYVRVIVTTNFDRLVERALEELGVSPTVISSADQLSGALPLVHTGATVIKLHGDYLDTRIRNTESELAAYEKGLDALLDRVLDEYGLIVSGWSGDWDLALRAGIERCSTRRFTTCWTTRSPLGASGSALAEHRKAVVLQVRDANQLFESLCEKVQALADLSAPHPLSAKMAAATVKRQVVDSSARVRLRDLVHAETERLFAQICAPDFGGQATLKAADEVKGRVAKYDSVCETLLSMITVGCYWSGVDQIKLWIDAMQRVANPTEIGQSLDYLRDLRRYPALLLLYGAGIASVAAENYFMLGALLLKPKTRDVHGKRESICSAVYPSAVMVRDVARVLPGMDRHHTPASDHLHARLRGALVEFLPDDEEYDSAFDRFEYLLGLVYADLKRRDVEGGWWGPFGRFAWKGSHFHHEGRTAAIVDAEIEERGVDWPLLKAGLFAGSLEQLRGAKSKFDGYLSRLSFH